MKDEAPPIVRIKACCIGSVAEIRQAIRWGVAILGFVSEMQSPGAADDDALRAMAGLVPPGVESVLLTTATQAQDIVLHAHRVPTTAIQFVRSVEPGELERVREALPATRLVQVVYVADDNAIDKAMQLAPHVDAIHLDSLHPHPSHPQLGGTGMTHDWSVSRRIVEAVPTPVILAGGLNSANVREAVETVRPYAVDVCTGVRDEAYRLVEERLAEFVAAATSIPTELPGSLAA